MDGKALLADPEEWGNGVGNIKLLLFLFFFFFGCKIKL